MTTDPPDHLISLRLAAEELSLHYMTVYRYVRTGRLPAVKVDGEWRVKRGDLQLLSPSPTEAPPATRLRYRGRLQDRLLAADELGAWSVVEAALASGADPEEIYLRLLIPAVRDIGQRWEAGDVAVVEEHQATAVATRIVGRMGPRFRRPGRRRGTVVVGAVSGDTHALAPALLADLLRGRRYDVIDLGGDTPAESFTEVVASVDDLRAVLVSCSTASALPAVADTVGALRRAGCPAPVLVGGCVMDPDQVAGSGADAGGSSAEEALALVDDAVARRRQDRHRPE
jgi:excisionase family DNA binding protein